MSITSTGVCFHRWLLGSTTCPPQPLRSNLNKQCPNVKYKREGNFMTLDNWILRKECKMGKNKLCLKQEEDMLKAQILTKKFEQECVYQLKLQTNRLSPVVYNQLLHGDVNWE